MRVNESMEAEKEKTNHLRIHYGAIIFLYLFTAFVTFKIISLAEAQKNLVTLLSTGAILATFGSAIGSIGLIWQNDLLERIRLNVDILFQDILKQESPWRRWPFLPRAGKRKLLDGSSHHVTLSNPQIPFDVGTHVIKVKLPTVLEDFFDLALFKNYWPLFRFRNSAHTVYRRKPKDQKSGDTGLTPSDEYMAYECMYDTWKAIFKYRTARYIVHFGSGLTTSGAIIVALYISL